MMRLVSLLFLGFFFLSCGSSSVYQMTDEEQKGLTYKLYQEAPSETFDQTLEVLRNYNSDLFRDQGWQVASSDLQEGRIETSWKETEESLDAGQMEGSNERYRIIAEISESGSGSRIFFQLEKQVRFSQDSEQRRQWQMYQVSTRDARTVLEPIFTELEDIGLTPQR